MIELRIPTVSIIIPTLNESKNISRVLDSLMDDFVRNEAEILFADAQSTDGTRDIISSLSRNNSSIRLIDNPEKFQVFGLNRAIQEARGRYIIRADAHSLYPEGYVRRCIQLLEETGAWNVGGVMVPRGDSFFQSAVALAMRHPVGVGDARFHLGNYSGFVDTVYLGAFPKDVFDRVGLYDPNNITNEDAELNLRILKAGGKIYLDGSLEVIYTPRNSLAALARQYFRYGRGRCYTTLKHKRMTSWRQAAPVLLIPGLAASIAAGLFFPLFFLIPPAYWMSLTLIGLLSRTGGTLFDRRRLILGTLFAVMHTCWGAGFLSFLFFRPSLRK
ncbi:MAG: glycosyltransferase family 2 protein [Acidobacteria bacterium]|nr:glycosyltransferase family 2 protein [Acidobacteriota bacterium]